MANFFLPTCVLFSIYNTLFCMYDVKRDLKCTVAWTSNHSRSRSLCLFRPLFLLLICFIINIHDTTNTFTSLTLPSSTSIANELTGNPLYSKLNNVRFNRSQLKRYICVSSNFTCVIYCIERRQQKE